MKEIRFIVSESEYSDIITLKADKTHRELYLDGLGIDYKIRRIGRPSLTATSIEEFKARKLAEYKQRGHDRYMRKIKEANERMRGK